MDCDFLKLLNDFLLFGDVGSDNSIKKCDTVGTVISSNTASAPFSSNLKKTLQNKDDQIISLQGEISGYVKKISILELEVQNRQNLVDVKDKQIKRMKTKMILGGTGGGLAIIGLILGIILIN